MLRILGRPTSINVRKVLWTAHEIGLDFEHEPDWAASKTTKTEEYRRLNPNALVPVVVDENGVLWESNAICRYLAGKHGRDDLLPVDPYARGHVEKWLDWQNSTLLETWRFAFMWRVRENPEFNHPDLVALSIERWNAAMMMLEAHFADGRDYAETGQFTLADIILTLAVQRWLSTPMDHCEAPALLDYRARMLERPAAQAAIDPSIP